MSEAGESIRMRISLWLLESDRMYASMNEILTEASTDVVLEPI